MKNKYERTRLTINLNHELETDLSSMFLELTNIEIYYTPYRPAPLCQDHDSPAFSDQGDDEEIEFVDPKSVCEDINICFNELVEQLRLKKEHLIKNVDLLIDSISTDQIEDKLEADEINRY